MTLTARPCIVLRRRWTCVHRFSSALDCFQNCAPSCAGNKTVWKSTAIFERFLRSVRQDFYFLSLTASTPGLCAFEPRKNMKQFQLNWRTQSRGRQIHDACHIWMGDKIGTVRHFLWPDTPQLRPWGSQQFWLYSSDTLQSWFLWLNELYTTTNNKVVKLIHKLSATNYWGTQHDALSRWNFWPFALGNSLGKMKVFWELFAGRRSDSAWGLADCFVVSLFRTSARNEIACFFVVLFVVCVLFLGWFVGFFVCFWSVWLFMLLLVLQSSWSRISWCFNTLHH